MTNWGNENDDAANLDPNNANGPKALRDAYAALKAQNDELLAGFTAMQAEAKAAKVQNVFNDLGVPNAASQYQGDADPAKITEWVTNMKAAFGGSGTPVPDTSIPPAVPDANLEQFQRMTQSGQSGGPIGSVEYAQAGVNDAKSIQDLIANSQKFMRG